MLSFYVTMLTGSLAEPRRFFSRLPQDMRPGKPFGYLMICSLVFAAASALTAMAGNPVIFVGMYVLNAVGMTCIAAGLGYVLIFVITGGRHVPFQQVFTIYAVASGTTLLAAWIPYFLILTEPWKWWLIGTGMTRSCRLSAFQALVVIGLSIGMIVCAFRFLLPLTLPKAV